MGYQGKEGRKGLVGVKEGRKEGKGRNEVKIPDTGVC